MKNEIFAGGSRENAPGSEKKEILSFWWVFMQNKKDPESSVSHSGIMLESSPRIKQDTAEDPEEKWKEIFDDIAEPLDQALFQSLDCFWILQLLESLIPFSD